MAAIFMDRFHNRFIVQVERYLTEQNLAFKVLLLVDNTPGHPGDLKVAHPNIGDFPATQHHLPDPSA